MNDSYLEFLTRSGCHLCEEAAPVVLRVARLTRQGVREVDVDADPELAVDWGLRIPVVRSPSGDVVAEGRISFVSLLRAAIAHRLRRLLTP